MSYFDIKQTRSRNWEIEEEEEEQTQAIDKPQPQLNLNNEKSDLKSKLLVVATRDAPSIYIRTMFSDKLVLVGEINISDVHPIRTNEPILNNRCQIYKYADADTLFVLCQFVVPEDRAFSMSRLIMESCRPEKVIIIDSLVDTQFISADHRHPQPPFIRSISTSNYQNVNGFTPLESPNLIQGFTASIISQCEVEGIQCISLQNLVEYAELSNSSVVNLENQMKKVHTIFEKVPIQSHQSYLKLVHLINRRDDRGLYM